MRASINSVATRYRVYRKKVGNNSKETDHAPLPNCKFSYVCMSKIVFITWLVLRTMKCCTHVIVYCVRRERERERERERKKELSGFENYRVALVLPQGSSLHTQVEKNRILEPAGRPLYLMATTKGIPKISNEHFTSPTFNLSLRTLFT